MIAGKEMVPVPPRIDAKLTMKEKYLSPFMGLSFILRRYENVQAL